MHGEKLIIYLVLLLHYHHHLLNFFLHKFAVPLFLPMSQIRADIQIYIFLFNRILQSQSFFDSLGFQLYRFLFSSLFPHIQIYISSLILLKSKRQNMFTFPCSDFGFS